MIAYNRTGYSNVLLLETAEQDHHNGLISGAELKEIKANHRTGFYTPSLFARIGMFLLTQVVSSFSAGFLTFIMFTVVTTHASIWLACLGVLNFIALEIMVREHKHFRSGVDDGLTWISIVLCCSSLATAIELSSVNDFILFSAFSCVITLFFAIRYADRLMSLLSYLSAFAFVFYAWQKTGSFGIQTMPFILMIFSGVTFFACIRVMKKQQESDYRHGIVFVKVAALITLYASGNYYVVKELGDMLNGAHSDSIPFGWIFWCWTLMLPLVCIAAGVRKKDIQLIRTGMLLSAAAVFTFRNYHHLMPAEYVLLISGAILLISSYLLIRYLRTPKHGFTDEELAGYPDEDRLKIESLLVSGSFSGLKQEEAGKTFGGGHFGCGGASGGF